MKAMTILNRCRRAEDDLRRLQQRIRQRREAAESVSPVLDDSGATGHSSIEPDRIAVLTCDVTALEASHGARTMARRAEVAAVCVFLDTLSETESAVLYSYYVNRQKTGLIAAKLKLAGGYVRRIKGEAERKLNTLDDATVGRALPPWYPKEWPETAAERGGVS